MEMCILILIWTYNLYFNKNLKNARDPIENQASINKSGVVVSTYKNT